MAALLNSGLLRRATRLVQGLCWAAVLAAPLITHLAIATGRLGSWATGLAMLEVMLFGALGLRKLRGSRRAVGAAVVTLLLILLAARALRPAWAGTVGLVAAAWMSHAFIYASLLLLFAGSLRPGGTDLITELAGRLRGGLTPAMRRYTRGVTKAWCVFFAGQIAISAMLLLLAPERVWSLFVNVLDVPCVVTMFAAEYAIRRWRFRHYPHISPMETFRSFAQTRAGG